MTFKELSSDVMAAVHLRNHYDEEIVKRQLALIKACEHKEVISCTWNDGGTSPFDGFVQMLCLGCRLCDAGHGHGSELLSKTAKPVSQAVFDEHKKRTDVPPVLYANNEVMEKLLQMSLPSEDAGTSAA